LSKYLVFLEVVLAQCCVLIYVTKVMICAVGSPVATCTSVHISAVVTVWQIVYHSMILNCVVPQMAPNVTTAL